MCIEPATALLVGSLIAAGTQVIGGISADRQGKQQQAFNEQAALDEDRRTLFEEQNKRDEFRSMMGRQTAQLAAAGIDIASPLGVSLARDSAEQLEQDVNTIRFSGAQHSDNLRQDGTNARSDGRNKLITGAGGAAATSLSGFAKFKGLTAKPKAKK